MCSRAEAIFDSLECYMEDLVASFEDFVKKSLMAITVIVGALIGMMVYMLKNVNARDGTAYTGTAYTGTAVTYGRTGGRQGDVYTADDADECPGAVKPYCGGGGHKRVSGISRHLSCASCGGFLNTSDDETVPSSLQCTKGAKIHDPCSQYETDKEPKPFCKGSILKKAESVASSTYTSVPPCQSITPICSTPSCEERLLRNICIPRQGSRRPINKVHDCINSTSGGNSGRVLCKSSRHVMETSCCTPPSCHSTKSSIDCDCNTQPTTCNSCKPSSYSLEKSLTPSCRTLDRKRITIPSKMTCESKSPLPISSLRTCGKIIDKFSCCSECCTDEDKL